MTDYTEYHAALLRASDQIVTLVDPENQPSQLNGADVIATCEAALAMLPHGDRLVLGDYWNPVRLVIDNTGTTPSSQVFVKTLLAAMLVNTWYDLADGVPYEVHYKVAV